MMPCMIESRLVLASRMLLGHMVFMVSMTKMRMAAGLTSSCHEKSSSATADETTNCDTTRLIVCLGAPCEGRGGGDAGGDGANL